MKNTQFPHISRLFSASTASFVTKIVLWGALSTILTINLLVGYDQHATRSTAYLTAPGAQLRLLVASAQSLWSGHKTEEARSLLSLAETVKTTRVLGAMTQPSDLITSWEQAYNKTNLLYQKWLAITVEKPNYRDAYLVASALAHNMGKETEAIALRQQAAIIDPLFVETQ